MVNSFRRLNMVSATDKKSPKVVLYKEEKMIRVIIRCQNNMVIVFDKEGEQVPEYQGWYDDVKEKILKDAPSDALFGHFRNYETELRVVPKGEW